MTNSDRNVNGRKGGMNRPSTERQSPGTCDGHLGAGEPVTSSSRRTWSSTGEPDGASIFLRPARAATNLIVAVQPARRSLS
jgi:hypothetical protein